MNVKQALQQLGWTYAEAAKQTGYSLDMIQSVALGRRDLPKPLAKLLNVAVDQQRTQVARINGLHKSDWIRNVLDRHSHHTS